MRWGLLLLSLCACGRLDFAAREAPAPDGPHVGFASRKPIVIDHTKLAADLAGFPLLVQDTELSRVDLAFLAEDGTPLAFEIEGTLAWVRIPMLSASADTTLYLAFDDPDVTTSQAQPPAVWADNYVGVWHFGDAMLADSTGAHPGTITGAVTSTPGYIGSAASFGGNFAGITILQSAALQPPSVTVSAWARETDIGTSTDRIATIVAQDSWRAAGTGSQGYYMEIYRTVTQPVATFYAADGPTYAHAFSTVNEPNATWYYSVGTFDSAAGMSSIYVDGALQGTQPMTGPIAYIDRPVNIGAGPGGWWMGQIDEVRISNVARSAAWIAAEYANQTNAATFAAVGATEPNP